jgi:hypothetical protein
VRPQPITAADLFIHPITERHNHIGEPASDLLVLWIRRPAEVLRLVAVPAYHIPLDPVLLFPPPRLEGVILGMDPVESPGAFGRVIKLAAKDTTIETTA